MVVKPDLTFKALRRGDDGIAPVRARRRYIVEMTVVAGLEMARQPGLEQHEQDRQNADQRRHGGDRRDRAEAQRPPARLRHACFLIAEHCFYFKAVI